MSGSDLKDKLDECYHFAELIDDQRRQIEELQTENSVLQEQNELLKRELAEAREAAHVAC